MSLFFTNLKEMLDKRSYTIQPIKSCKLFYYVSIQVLCFLLQVLLSVRKSDQGAFV